MKPAYSNAIFWIAIVAALVLVVRFINWLIQKLTGKCVSRKCRRQNFNKRFGLAEGFGSKCYSCEAQTAGQGIGYPAKCIDCEAGRSSAIEYQLGFPPPAPVMGRI
jgi:hypothetical protein